MEFVLGVLKILFPFIAILVLGVGAIYLFFYFQEHKKDKIWTKDLKKLYEEAGIEKDKQLHEELMLRESFSDSLERLKDFLTTIHTKKEGSFSLTALDAILIIKIFPFDIRKSKDGTYYIIDENEFLFFLKYLINENYEFISDERLVKIRNILTKELMKWNPEDIVVDARFVFDLIKNDNIPSGDIEDQKFIKIAPVLQEKVLFKIEKTEKKNENEEKDENKTEKNNKHFSLEEDLLDSMSDDNFINDFAINSNEKNQNKTEEINYQNLSSVENSLFFLFNEIENNNYPLTSEKEKQIKENLFNKIKEIYYYRSNKKYYIKIEDLLKIILIIENVKDYDENIINKEFNNFLKRRSEEKNYKILSKFVENFELFNEIISTTNNEILISLNLDNFFILEKIKENGIELSFLKLNQIKSF